ncbi:MAG: maltose alpha-D-glucosyltransferase [Candidatus Omnitrophota bacterium]|nr:maltose alpha-D-glucosyltransferase [Candidatus Omnitrophota bacterium]
MSDPLWYKNAIIYQLHVRTFCDANGDGIGDFRGLTSKLGYLQDLGVTAVWLLPFYPSPLKDDGYDTADYTAIHPHYGTMADFKRFLSEAHRRGIKVITELVLNHTSDRHPWFQRARRAGPSSKEREFYVWSPTPDRYKDARIIFKDFEKSNWSWDSVAKAYYWHRFYSHQPDLNYDNPHVRKEILSVADFWFGLGVDGLRLDAVPYLFEREGTNCENLPQSHAFLKELRRHVDRKFKDRMLLAEANQWPEDARAYFGNGDECHMAFHFPVMPRLFMAIRQEDRFPIVDILEQTPEIPPGCQWGMFLRNHDELTLEMVTDEDRDYMVRVYARDRKARINLGIRRRLAPLMGNHRRKIELMKGLLFSLPGSPILYYGDEIGMGDNIRLPDRDGVRTPMQWNEERNAGFSKAPAKKLVQPLITDPEYRAEVVNARAQESDPHSLLWHMRRLIALRKQYRAFGQGKMRFLNPENAKILAFTRELGEEKVLVVANLSRFVQPVHLDLSEWKGRTPVELFGATRFPLVGESPYFLTMAPHSFYWFALEAPRPAVPSEPVEEPVPVLEAGGRWDDLVLPGGRRSLEEILPAYVRRQRWFGGKGRVIRRITVEEAVPLQSSEARGYWLFLRVYYLEGEAERYLLPLSYSEMLPPGIVARVKLRGRQQGYLRDALGDKGFCRSVLAMMARRRSLQGEWGELVAETAGPFRKLRNPKESLEPSLLKTEQSNSAVTFGSRWFLKIFRGVGEGINPELELLRFLTEKTSFESFPALGGFLEYKSPGAEPGTVAILQRYVPNEGDAWSHTLDALGRYFEEALAAGKEEPALPEGSLLDLASREPPRLAQESIGGYLESVKAMGRRTAQLHLALSSDPSDAQFAPEPFGELYQRSVYQSLRGTAIRALRLLKLREGTLPESTRPQAKQVLEREPEILKEFGQLLSRRVQAQKIRCHGDFHLGQVLYTGKDFVIMDFEGEPARPLGERRIKRSPLRDVAGMLRSFQYAADAALLARDAGSPVRPEDQVKLEAWSRFWQTWVSAVFLNSYLVEASKGNFLPKKKEDLDLLLRIFLLQKALYELHYEMNHRPEWIRIPLRGILRLLDEKN